MLLTIDFGNTKIKTALFDEDILIKHKAFTSVDELIKHSAKTKHDAAAVSSVAPAKLEDFVSRYFSFFKKEPFVINNKLSFNLKINYDTPNTLGIDRICSSEGAFFLFKQSPAYSSYNNQTYFIVVDFGTATTVEIISYPGVFEGGLILPGLNMMYKSLSKNTAQLPLINLEDYKNFIGKSTHESIASGVLNAQAGIVDRAVNFVKELLEFPFISIYITGGVAKHILPFIQHTYFYEPNLVLYGINQVY
ncbi:MAG: type III pantothenate kinase, partial [Ignavibacteriaceae bacterium]|nr:type III pantothenate kinase [Ignavibacteriaceae bacterium]